MERPQAQRQCRGREGRLWICPHRVWSFCDMISAAPIETRSCDRCFNRHLFLGPLCVTVQYPLLRIPKRARFDLLAIREALNILRVRLCPHLLANDKIILNSFHSDCTKVSNCRSPLPCCAYNAGNPPRCTSCRTSVYFQVSESKKDGSSSVTFLVYRHLGKRGGGITDPDWIAQLTMPEEIIEM